MRALTVSRHAQLPSPAPFRGWPAGPQWLWVTGPTGGSIVSYGGFTFICGLNTDAGIRVMRINNTTGAVVVSPQILNMGILDAHATPTLAVRADGRLVLTVSPHAAAHLWVAISTSVLDVSAWGTATDIAASIGAVSVTYCYVLQFADGTTNIFYREGDSNSDQLYVTVSADGGVTWGARGMVFDPSGHGAYWSISSDGVRTDLIAGNGSATVGVNPLATASVFHTYLQGGVWHKSDGTAIRSGIAPTPALTPADLTKIYDGAVLGGLDQPQFSITRGATPIAGWSALDPVDPTNNNAKYWTAYYASAGGWVVASPTDIGCPPSGGTGGIAVDPVDPRYAFASRKQPDGTFQIELLKTRDGGATWAVTQTITNDGAIGQVNMGLVAPQNASPAVRVVWLAGAYPKSINSIDLNAFNLRSVPNSMALS